MEENKQNKYYIIPGFLATGCVIAGVFLGAAGILGIIHGGIRNDSSLSSIISPARDISMISGAAILIFFIFIAWTAKSLKIFLFHFIGYVSGLIGSLLIIAASSLIGFIVTFPLGIFGAKTTLTPIATLLVAATINIFVAQKVIRYIIKITAGNKNHKNVSSVQE